MIDVLVEPSIAEAEGFIRKNIGRCLLIVGNCCVEYRGRASSKIGPGERIVIIKEDGALLIHRSTGYEPINWMPGTGVIYNVKVLGKEKTNWFKSSGDWQTTDKKTQHLANCSLSFSCNRCMVQFLVGNAYRLPKLSEDYL